jgi:hypothetical protein
MLHTPMEHHTKSRIDEILQPAHILCREDVVWTLEYIKKKLAEEDPAFLELPSSRLLKNFHYFAEIAMMLIHRHQPQDQEMNRLKMWMAEAAYGLRPQERPIPPQSS